jgi:hypothetical protein
MGFVLRAPLKDIKTFPHHASDDLPSSDLTPLRSPILSARAAALPFRR